jgi:hypothetical protein
VKQLASLFTVVVLAMGFHSPLGRAVAAEIAEASGLAIVRNGQARAVIVIAGNADGQTTKAASVLVDYVRKSTGAQLPVVSERTDRAEECIQIFVGESATSVDPQIAAGVEDLDEQGFLIRSHGDSIAIVGRSVWGTLHGVYDFLERYVGVRWLLPGPDGEDVPQLRDVFVPWEEIREEPAFQYRTISPIRGSPDSPGSMQWHNEWAQRNKLQGAYNDKIRFHHNLHSVFPPEKYGKTHCELYPNCRPPAPGQQTGWQPCFTAEGSVEIAASEIIDYFATRPHETFFSLGVNDSRGHCEASPSHPDYPGRLNSVGLVDMSDIYYAWVNEVVTRVLEVYPDKWFGLLAYYDVMDPPSFPLHPRVIPFVTKDRMAWIDEGIRDAGHKQMDAWNEVASQVAWYDYMYGANFYVVPRIFSHVMAENFRYAKHNQVVGTYTEMYHTVLDGPKPWLSARLQWNPDQDVDLLLQEWYERAVGPAAADDLAAFYDLWEHFWTERIKESSWFIWSKGRTYLPFNDKGYVHLVTDEDISQSKRLLASAVAKAQTPQQKARARLIQQAFAYCEASVVSYPRQVEPLEEESAALATLAKLEDTLEERVYAAQRRYVIVREFGAHPLLRFPLEKRIGDWTGWPVEDFSHLVRYMHERERAGGPVTEQVRLMAKEDSSKQMRAFAELLLQVRDGTPSLTQASSFEDPTQTARRWNKWIVSAGSIQRVEGVSYTGQASLLIEGMERGGPHQTFDVQPGLAAVVVRYYTPSGSEEGTIQLIFHIKNAQGANLASYQSSRINLSSSAGTWSTLGLLEDIPAIVDGQKVARAQVVVTIDSAPDTSVYVDDVVVCYSRTAVPASVYEQLIQFEGLERASQNLAGIVSGMLDAQVTLSLADQETTESVQILLDDQPVYASSGLPTAGEVMIDTRTLPDGRHELTANIVLAQIGPLTKSVGVTTRNFWTLVDPFEPPTEMSWFGSVDRSKTSEESVGWQYSTDQTEEFWGDADRKLRTGNTTEYLIWETPLLCQFSMTLYARTSDISEIIDICVSSDGSTWDSLPYAVKDAGQSVHGWRKLLLEGDASDKKEVAFLRLALRESPAYEEIHLGEARFQGLR